MTSILKNYRLFHFEVNSFHHTVRRRLSFLETNTPIIRALVCKKLGKEIQDYSYREANELIFHMDGMHLFLEPKVKRIILEVDHDLILMVYLENTKHISREERCFL